MTISKLPLIIFSFLTFLNVQSQEISLEWQPREDLNANLPSSIRIYDSYSTLPDGKPLRAMYAEVDLRDKNLKIRSIGSDTHRETTMETYENNNAILAINGGYFASDSSVSLIVEDGEIISAGQNTKPRGAFGMVNGQPEITWTLPNFNNKGILKLKTPNSEKSSETWQPTQAVGGGPVLIMNNKIVLNTGSEGFGDSHAIRHPRSAIGYKNEHILIILAVDGRQEASVGVSLSELAQIMKQLEVNAAVNLDGGGSTAMIASDEVVNVPVNITGGNRNALRNNAGALVISERVSTKKEIPLYFDTEDATYKESGLWKNSNLSNYYGTSPSRAAQGNATNKATYNFNDVPSKRYEMSVWFSTDTENNSSQVNYILHRSNKIDTIKVNQADIGLLGKWISLGNFQLKSSDRLEISASDRKQFTVDALRLIPSGDIPEVPVRGDLRIGVISDLNSGLGAIDYEWQVDSIIQRIPRIWQPDMVISGGDLIAGMGISDPNHLQKMWDGFTEHIAKPLNKNGIPFAFTLGNHDGPRSFTVEHDFAKKYWNESDNKPKLNFVDDSNFPNYYSFVHDDVFFVSWEASSPIITEENLKWMEAQFQLPIAKNAKFRFVMGHMPLYSVAQERDSKGDVLENPEHLRQLLERYKVHTYISGHQHAFYPGQRGALQLLNTGAAGSGARSWLTQELAPTNTITIMDLFYDTGEIRYTTYHIKEKKASDMKVFDITALPSMISGVNGYVLRSDRQRFQEGTGNFYTENENSDQTVSGDFTAKNNGDKITVVGNLQFGNPHRQKSAQLALYKGRNSEQGTLYKNLKSLKIKNGKTSFSTHITPTEELEDLLAVGGLYLKVIIAKDTLRAQIYPLENQPPGRPEIISHHSKNTYGVRNLNVLGRVNWSPANDPDGDFVTYNYQIAKDPEFNSLVYSAKSGRSASLKFEEKEWFKLLNHLDVGQSQTFYHRVLATDGIHQVSSEVSKLNLIKSDEELTDLAEIAPPDYKYVGKIADSGAGYGALWDNENKIWLADYNQGLRVKKSDGNNADFSPLTSVEIGGKSYPLKPVNGIGKDLDGNILAGINRHLIKIDAVTGQGIAVWEVPKGNRAITSPRAANDGSIYAMSLFGDDGNFVLKQNGQTFDLIKTIKLEDRILSRTFAMSADGHTLYFPDPGSGITQVFHSDTGNTYTKATLIKSLNAGSSALQVRESALYFAVRASGILPSSFHYRNTEKKEMWTLSLPEVNGAEPRGIGVSKDGTQLIFCSYDTGGGYYLYQLQH